MVLSIVVANFLANTIVKPVNYLVKVTKRISQGDFSVKVEKRSKNEIGELEMTFSLMASSLQERDQEIKSLNEQRLMRSEKLASIGRLAAGIAHEINNPLTAVLTFSSLLLRKAEEPQKEKLEIIVKETTRCREIVRGLLNFARQNEPLKQICSVNDVIENALSLTRNQLKVSDNRVTVIREFGDIPAIAIDPNQMLEAFINIIINAIDAMPGGGTLSVTTRRIEGENRIEIWFIDTGCGIPKVHLEQIFDPFFTTKDPGKGTGLGLAVTYGIIERHNGTIHVESEVEKGTTFIIKLPMD
jgi:two-component system NtrC family sensor kinase